MRGRLVAASLAVVSGVAGAAQDGDTALCDELAREIRRREPLVTGTSKQGVLDALSSGTSPAMALASKPELDWYPTRDGETPSGLDVFQRRYRPTAGLVGEVREFVMYGGYEIRSLGPALHVMVNVAGSAGCESFLMFRTDATGRAHSIDQPELPKDSMAYCVGGRGMPARIRQRDVFLGYFPDTLSHDESFRVIPLSGSTWEPGCSMSVTFDTRRDVSATYLPPDPVLTAARLREIALRIANGPAIDDGYGWVRFGESGQVGDAAKARLLRKLALSEVPDPIPTFRAPAPVYSDIQVPHAQFIVVDGRTFVAVSDHAGLGWRTFRDFVVVVYDLDGNRAKPVGTAVVDTHRRGLQSIDIQAHTVPTLSGQS